MKKTILCSAFPGCGKSFIFNNEKSEKKILDSDSSLFDKNNFPENYLKHITENIGKADLIMISSHKEVRDALTNANLDFLLVFPDISLKDEFINRYRERGSSEKFIEFLSKNWERFILELEHQKKCTKLKLQTGENLSDVLSEFIELKF